jgi:hypothetical protein
VKPVAMEIHSENVEQLEARKARTMRDINEFEAQLEVSPAERYAIYRLECLYDCLKTIDEEIAKRNQSQ